MATDGHAVGMVDYFSPGEATWAPLLRGAVSHLGHACEYETGLTLALANEDETKRVADAATGLPPRKTQPWIAPGHDHDPVSAAGAAWPPIFQADDCGYFGDPACASRDGGAALLEVTVARLAAFIEAFAATPLRVGVARDAASPRIAPALAPLRR
jgi:creatinine amidohydrolase